MKLKSFLLMALAASTTLAACDKSEESGPTSDTTPKSVTVTLPNIDQTPRAIGNKLDASQAALANFKIFFLDNNNNVQEVPDYPAGTPQKVYFTNENIPASGNTYTYHFIPAATTKVVIVGNMGEISDEQFVTEVVNKKLPVLNDGDTGITTTTNGNPLYPLYGEDDLTLDATATDGEGHKNVYKAAVNLAPQVARLEIVNFSYTKDENVEYSYKSLKMSKIALSNYYTSYALANGAHDGDVVKCPEETTQIWDWINTTAVAPWADTFGDTFTVSQDATVEVAVADGKIVPFAATETATAATQAITYGLTKVDQAANNPELMLSFYGVNETEEGVVTETPHYLRAKFTSKEAFAPGKIYRVNFKINEGATAPWDDPERCVMLTVTVKNWEVVTIEPEF